MRIFYKLLTIGCLFSLPALQSLAQSQSQSTAPYIIVKATYAFPAASQKISETSVTVNKSTYTQGVYGSYGRGINLSLGVGKMLNPTFGVEMNAQFLLGNAITTTYSSDQDSASGSQSDRIRGLLLKPFIVIRNSGDLLSIYTKLGLAIATVTNRYEQVDERYILGNQTYQESTESTETAKAKVGFAACFGFAFRVSEGVSLFVEANGQILALPITKGHFTKYTKNGQDQLPSKPTNEASWVYEKAVVYDPNATPDNSKPEVRLYNPAYFSYVGVGAGFIYHF